MKTFPSSSGILVLPRAIASALIVSLVAACGGGGAVVDSVAGGPAGSASVVFTSVEVAPVTPTIAVGANAQLVATARDQNSSPITGVPVATWTSSNNSVVSVNGSGAAIGVAAGSAVVTASISAGGVTRTGTATVTVLAPGASPTVVTTVTTPNLTFSPATVTVGTGATVTWQFSGATHNVTFGVLKPTGGDVPDTSPGSAASRVFATAGTYGYECTRHSGMAGQVVVAGGAAPPPQTPPPQTPPPQTPPPTSGTLVQATLAAFTPERVEIAPGGTVTWEFIGGSNGIVFDDLAPPGGNIPQSSAGTRVSRTFPAAGDYDYRSSVNSDVKGRVRVR